MTLQPQLTMLRTVPSTVVACCPCTACPNCGDVPRFWAVAARGATRVPKRMRARANIRTIRTQLLASGRWMTVVNGMADPSERRQKADAVLIRFSPGRGCSWPPCREGECGQMKTRSNGLSEIEEEGRKGRVHPIFNHSCDFASSDPKNEMTVSFRSGSV